MPQALCSSLLKIESQIFVVYFTLLSLKRATCCSSLQWFEAGACFFLQMQESVSRWFKFKPGCCHDWGTTLNCKVLSKAYWPMTSFLFFTVGSKIVPHCSLSVLVQIHAFLAIQFCLCLQTDLFVNIRKAKQNLDSYLLWTKILHLKNLWFRTLLPNIKH